MGSVEEEMKEDSKAVEDSNLEMGSEKKENRAEMQKKGNKDKRKKKLKQRRNFILRRFSCIRMDDEYPTVDEPTGEGSFNMQAVTDRTPTHLIVMVNGIIGR